MIRFVEVTGIDIEEDTKCFAFFNTVTDMFVDVGGTHIFDSVKEFEDFARHGEDYDRMKRLIQKNWL